jgi:hypothetical protein
MGMTNDGRPLEYPDNPLTRAMAAPQVVRGGISATPPPSVKSGAWGTEPRLSENEQTELDTKLAEYLGAATPQVPELKRLAPPLSIPQKKARMNFNNIQRIDLEREVIVVDDMEFPLAPEDVRHLRLLCIDCVLNAVVSGLRDVLGESGIEPTQLTGVLKEDVLGRRQETPTLPLGPPVSGPGESAEGKVETSEQE